MLLTDAVTTRPSARRVAVIAPATSINDMIQPAEDIARWIGVGRHPRTDIIGRPRSARNRAHF
jgi:hypothetical protein